MPYTKPYTLDPTSGGDTVKDAIVTKTDGNVDYLLTSLNAHAALTSTHGVGEIVGLTSTQTLTNKTLTSPILNTGVSGSAISTSTALGTSDIIISSQNAVKTYADLKLAKASNLSDLANAGTARTNLGVAIGSDVQAYDATLAGLAALTTTSSAADKIPFFTGVDTFDTCAFTTTARALVDDASIATMQGTLGIGSAGLVSTGAFDAAGSVVSDAAFVTSWDGVTTIAPSKNAVWDALGTGASPTHVGMILSGLTSSLPVFTGASKELVSKSVADTQTALAIPTEGAWIDYFATSTIVGWAAGKTGSIWYKVLGKIVFVLYNITGTSDANTASCTLPLSGSFASNHSIPYLINNGVETAGGLCGLSGATASFYRDVAATAWTTSGNKRVSGTFFYAIS